MTREIESISTVRSPAELRAARALASDRRRVAGSAGLAAQELGGRARRGEGVTDRDYSAWLGRKLATAVPTGFEPGELSPALFQFQADLVKWALRRGRAALFADTGLGKTLMQLEWAWRVHVRTGLPVLVLTPLAVAAQSVAEARRFGIEAPLCRDAADWSPGINVTNYERLHRFESVLAEIGGVVLDESSCLKDFTSKTRTDLIERFRSVPFRLACTATPSPNDHTELGNHAEFLGVMTRQEMLASYFINDGDKANTWRLKRHAEQDFWRWVCSWAALVRKPSDLGYDDGRFELPPLVTQDVVLSATNEAAKQQGRLFVEPASTLSEQRTARRGTLHERCSAVAELVASEPNEPWLVWCELNDESAELARLIHGAVEVVGSDTPESKERALLGFACGEHRILVSKPSIAGMGMNFQRCARMVFVGLSHSFEQYYQAVRRCWRFGQEREVRVYIVAHELEGSVVENVRRKHADAERMGAELSRLAGEFVRASVLGAARTHDGYAAHEEMVVPTWLEVAE
jgi:superfamily II DNA or RNA helicase